MLKISNKHRHAQSGFTLIELVIVIVIIGILAAVAIPNLSSTSADARMGKASATLGALKGAWGVAYSSAKSNPTVTQIAAAMADPACGVAATNNITCTGVTVSGGGSTLVQFSTAGGAITSPAGISCAAADCG